MAGRDSGQLAAINDDVLRMVMPDCGKCKELKSESQPDCKRVCTDLDLSDGKLQDFKEEDAYESVVRLDLRRNELPSLPEWISELTSLQHLAVSQNGLESLPPEIGNLTQLRSLNVSENLLETLPPDRAARATAGARFE